MHKSDYGTFLIGKGPNWRCKTLETGAYAVGSQRSDKNTIELLGVAVSRSADESSGTGTKGDVEADCASTIRDRTEKAHSSIP